MPPKQYDDIYEAIRLADKEGRTEDVKRLSEYLDELARSDRTTMTPKELPIGEKVSPELGAAVSSGTGAVLMGGGSFYEKMKKAEAKRTAEAISKALANQFPAAAVPQAPTLPTVGGVPVTPSSLQGGGAGNWNAQLGTNFAGAQMDKGSLDTGKRLASIINRGGEFAGGSLTPSGIAVPPSATPLPGAVPKAPPQAPLSLLQRLYQGGGNMLTRAGQAVAPVIEKAAGIATPLIGYGGAGYNLADAYNRYQIGGVPDALLPLSAAGAGVTAMRARDPRISIPAAGYTVLEPMIQDYWDKVKRGEIRHEAPDYSHSDPMGSQYATGGLVYLAKGGHTTPAWQRKEGKNPEGGLNAAGRASYNRETGGNLKRPQPEGGSRRDSFCARMKGMKKKLTSAETANDPDSRINKSLRAWNC